MTRELYDSFYEDVLKPHIKSYIVKNNENPNRVCDVDSSYPKYEIYENYQVQKTMFRVLLGKDVPKTENTFQLHRHRVCACMTAAIINCRPIYATKGFPEDSDITLLNTPIINEQLALSIGLALLRAYVLADKEETERHEYFSGTDFYVPPSFNYDKQEKHDFDTLIAGSFYRANILNNVSPPLLADIYFLLDRYHEANCRLYAKA